MDSRCVFATGGDDRQEVARRRFAKDANPATNLSEMSESACTVPRCVCKLRQDGGEKGPSDGDLTGRGSCARV